MNLLWYVGAFVLALGVLIVFHELGHFLVARWCGVQVLRFAVGFGKPLFSRRYGKDATEWVVAAFPLGGYVKMLDEREEPVPAHLLHRAFNRQSVWKRMAIVIAGPLANLLLAIMIYCGVFMHGVSDLKPVLAAPAAESIAGIAGFTNGDLILSIDDEPVLTWTELSKTLLNAMLDQRRLAVRVKQADGSAAFRQLNAAGLTFDDGEADPAHKFGLHPFRPTLAPVIGSVTPNSPAGIAGVAADDVVIAINGEPIREWEQVVAKIRPAFGEKLSLELERKGVRRQLDLIPEKIEENGHPYGRLGIAPRYDPALYAPYVVNVQYGFITALGKAVTEVWNTSALSLRMIGRMITGRISIKNLSGPVTIADYAGQSAKMGITAYLRFIAIISISLGVLNLLPVPVLDGGHLMYYLAELFKGSPVSDRILAGQKLGFGILGVLMLFALYNDLHRLIAS